MKGELIAFPARPPGLSREDGASAAARVLATPLSEREEKAAELRLEDPEMLVSVTEELRARLESSPATVRDDAEFLFHFLEEPRRDIGKFDERDYFLGELALIAGTACRFLFRREEARHWFVRSEASFVLTENASSNLARLAYQRLALAAEERRFEEVLESSPRWAENFLQLGMPAEALKCRFLEGAALREIGEMPRAIDVFRKICDEAEESGNSRLHAIASSNLAQFYRVAGDLDEALAYALKALPLLQRTQNRINIAKLRWCVADILREQGNRTEALESYRSALSEAKEIGIRGDVAALHLVVADLLLEAGHERQAEWEIRAALPIIEEEHMVPEGLAALGLLRESLLRRQINRQALRELHGYFPQA